MFLFLWVFFSFANGSSYSLTYLKLLDDTHCFNFIYIGSLFNFSNSCNPSVSRNKYTYLFCRIGSFISIFFTKTGIPFSPGEGCIKSYFKHVTLHKKWSFPWRISPVNVTKSAVSYGFDHIYWRNPSVGNYSLKKLRL